MGIVNLGPARAYRPSQYNCTPGIWDFKGTSGLRGHTVVKLNSFAVYISTVVRMPAKSMHNFIFGHQESSLSKQNLMLAMPLVDYCTDYM